MARILLADDELKLAQSLVKTLEAAGYSVDFALNGQRALDMFRKDPPDLVLLDVMMPMMDGYETCEAIRKIDRDIPIVFLTALESEADQIRGLDIGADDYVVKTASEELLLARLRKVLTRSTRFRLDSAPKEMTRTEATIYQLLKSAPNRYFSYREIGDAICGEGYVWDENSVRVNVSRMRKKLPKGEAVDAKRGFGFRLF